MKSDTKFILQLCVVAGVVLAVLLAPLFAIDWYRAGIQADIYRRQGITMTQWEVFMGAEPAEKVIQVRE